MNGVIGTRTHDCARHFGMWDTDCKGCLLFAGKGRKMLCIFGEEKGITFFMLLFYIGGILSRIALGCLYAGLIRETENMAVTKNTMLKHCKLKFIRCFQLNGGVNNVSVFVDRFVSRLNIGPFSYHSLYHISGQAMLFSVVMAGIGICKSLAGGHSFGEILPYYTVCIVGLYLFFAVSAAVDIEGKRKLLEINLVDYLENHLSARIETTQEDMEGLGYVQPGESFSGKSPEKLRRMEGDSFEKGGEKGNFGEKLRRMEGDPFEIGGEKGNFGEKLRRMEGDGIGKRCRMEEISGVEDQDYEMESGRDEQVDNRKDNREDNLTKETLVTQEEWEALIREIMTI